MTKHARLSPSSAVKWMACPGSVVLEAQCPETSSAHADEGTAAHKLAALVLKGALTQADDFIDQELNGYTVDDEMAEHVQAYVDYINFLQGTCHIEAPLDIQSITGESNARGTADAIVIRNDLIVVDFKYGKGVKVEAENNTQLMLYALAALQTYCPRVSSVKLVIFQPRMNNISEWECSPEALEVFADTVKRAANRCFSAINYAKYNGVTHDSHLVPGIRQCRWCRAKPTCPGLRSHVLATVADNHVDINKPVLPQLEGVKERVMDNAILGNVLGAVPLIEDWCKSIRVKAQEELLASRSVPGFKLVRGKRGARQWVDEDALTRLAGSEDPIDIFSVDIVSPTVAELRAKTGRISPEQWETLQAHIIQPEGAPQVAPESDKRAPFSVVSRVEDFQPV